MIDYKALYHHFKENLKEMEHLLLTASEASHVLGVAPTTVRRWIKKGELVALSTLGNSKKYLTASSVDKKLKELDAKRSKKSVSVH